MYPCFYRELGESRLNTQVITIFFNRNAHRHRCSLLVFSKQSSIISKIRKLHNYCPIETLYFLYQVVI